MFDDNGDMRITKTKSTLKKKLQVENSARLVLPTNVAIVDGCAMLWVIPWPSSKGNVEHFIINVISYFNRLLQKCKTHIIFDRYYEQSTKNCTRKSRAGAVASRQHQLTLTIPLLPQKVLLSVTENKVQLIDLIWKYQLSDSGTKLVVTGFLPVPLQFFRGNVTERHYLKTTHEKADVIIVQRMVHLASKGIQTIKVICDDTDVFVLLVHYYSSEGLTCEVSMEGTREIYC